MNTHLISVAQFCQHHNIELSFAEAVQAYELVPVTYVDEVVYVDEEALPHLERILHLHRDLNINFEGIDAIMHMLQRMEAQEQELIAMRNRLRFYEGS